MKKEIFNQLANLKHSVFKLAGNISKERKKYNKGVKSLQKEYNIKVDEDLNNLSGIIKKVYDIVTLIFKKEDKNGTKK